MDRLKQLIHEIHRRSLWQVLGIYVVGGWIAFEVVQTLTEGLGLPAWFPALAIVLLLIGLPVVMATAFVQEGGPTTSRPSGSLIDASGRIIERPRTAPPSAGGASKLLTWRNALVGGALAFALWGVVATGWILLGNRSTRPADESPARPSLAVLPFDNLSPDPDNAYFAAGIHEEILTQLARIEGIKLISRTSVLRYGDTQHSLTEIAEELGVSTILEGSIRSAAGRVRITTQLIDAASDEHLWAESYERPLSVENLLSLQTEVATRVVEELKGVLTPEERAELTWRPTDNLEAYAHYLRGHEHFGRLFAEDQARAAAEAYERAVELDPGFVAAWSRLVLARTWLAWVWGSPEERRQARADLDHLEGLAPESPELRLARGLWLYYMAQRYPEALREFDVLADLWPGDVYVMLNQGAILRRLGRREQAVSVWERALELDPANASIAYSIGQTYTSMRRFDEGERYARLAVSLNPIPVHWWSLIFNHLSSGETTAAAAVVDSAGPSLVVGGVESGGWWALWQVFSGDVDDALRLYRECYRQPTFLDGTWWQSWDLGLAAATASGRRDEASELADTLRLQVETALPTIPAEDRFVRSRALSQLALAHAYLGNEEHAVRFAREAVELLPVARDALAGPLRVRVEAQVYAVTGRPDQAVDRLRYLLSIPVEGVTVPMLRMDPRWASIRDDPGFQALVGADQD